MAAVDDGLVLNFAVSNEPWQAKPSFKGGRWKDRLSAKKAAQHRVQKSQDNISKSQPHEESISKVAEDLTNSGPRPLKRLRVEGEPSADYQPSHRQTSDESRAARTEQRRGAPKEVISSLFTYNPVSKANTVDKSETLEEEAVVPSNAPLSAELDQFTSLGLDPTIAHHLLKKMNVKSPTAIQSSAIAQLLKEDTDAFLQAETGSGKTLAYLLPIVQRLVRLFAQLRSESQTGQTPSIGRDAGLFAIILAPTRELGKQISTVLESLLGCAHYIVAGIVTGGEKKKSEKARLRKGVNILVATPGRLADHLANTEVLDVSRVRWLVLDEGDRLMELGFEQDIQRIVSLLNLRMRKDATGHGDTAADKAMMSLLPARRTTVLCSATLKTNVMRLGEISLKDAAHIAVTRSARDATHTGESTDDARFSAPAQLQQSYAVVPAKMRLVALVAMLRKTFDRRGSVMKAIVFISCADSVDFHFELLTRIVADATSSSAAKTDDADGRDTGTEVESSGANSTLAAGKIRQGGTISELCTTALGTSISTSANPVTVSRLHGSLPQAIRTQTLKAFADSQEPSVLVCTDVASRGLDLPNIDLVIEYDPPFSKDDHLHRIGRTARAGRDGRAVMFLQPGVEEAYVEIIKQGRRDANRAVSRRDADEIVKKGFTPTSGVINRDAKAWETEATQWQLDVERWVLENPRHMEQARRAFQSHVRAYATHVAAERQYFDIKQLHLGHLAKAFALRDRPGAIKVPSSRPSKTDSAADRKRASRAKTTADGGGDGTAKPERRMDRDEAGAEDIRNGARKMREKMRTMGAASEFNLG